MTTPNRSTQIHRSTHRDLQLSQQMTRNRLIRHRRETYRVPVSQVEMRPQSVYLVGKRPPLSQYPRLWRWLARFIYHRIGWAPEHGIEFQGVFDTEAAARFAASAPGAFYMELPLNMELPEETVQFGIHDFPLSEDSSGYRRREWPFVAITRSELAQLETMVEQTALCSEGKCEPKAV